MKLVLQSIVMSWIFTSSPIFAQQGAVESKQLFRTEEILSTPEGIQLQLVNLNSNVNSWYLLRIKETPQARVRVINLHNPGAPTQALRLSPNDPGTLEIVQGHRVLVSCPDVVKVTSSPKALAFPFSPICDGKIYVRNKANGYQPNMEKAVQILRENLGSFAESVINTAKEAVFEDKYNEDASLGAGSGGHDSFESKALKSALLNEKFIGQAITNHKLGVLLLTGYDPKKLNIGEWYPARLIPHVYVSVITPGMVSPEILKSHLSRVSPLQTGERNALVYLIAFDMKKHTLGWAHGTNHPGIGWSDRLSAEKINEFGGGLGPDGVNSFGDLVNPGHVPPNDLPHTVATISGGFQLKHSHFRWGKYATVNKSTHFGFIDNGVVMMSPSPGLSTLYARIDGSINMKTWSENDNVELPKIRYLRQNGLPLIEPGSDGEGIPGDHVGNLGHGNWSGSAEGNTYTSRGAACLIEKQGEQYFVYAYFSAATPSAMARVFQAYGCKQAIHLDMNSPGQAYLSLLTISKNSILPQPLTTDMVSVNPRKDVPRYLAVPDFRDFFWVMRN